MLLFPKGDVLRDLVILFVFSKEYSILKKIKSWKHFYTFSYWICFGKTLEILTLSALVSPLRNTENIHHALNTSLLRKMIFQALYQAILLNISNTNFWKPWLFKDIYGSINETENRFSQTIVAPSMSGLVNIFVYQAIVSIIPIWLNSHIVDI